VSMIRLQPTSSRGATLRRSSGSSIAAEICRRATAVKGRRSQRLLVSAAVASSMKAKMTGRDTQVFIKLVIDGETDRVLGCHIVGEAAAEMIQCVAVAVKMKATKADFDATMALHPSAAEELMLLRLKVK